jgi:hypothetical protein
VDRSTLTESGQIDPAGQVIAELQEEVGIDAAAVMPTRLVSFSEESLHHSFELAWELETPLYAATILDSHAALTHREHTAITFVPWGDLEGFLAHDPNAAALRSRHFWAISCRRKNTHLTPLIPQNGRPECFLFSSVVAHFRDSSARVPGLAACRALDHAQRCFQ